MLKKYLSKNKKNSRKRLPCYFCKNKIEEISYTEKEVIGRFLTSRGKIIGRVYSGNCARHQKLLGRAIKRARVLSLLPYIESHAIS